MATCDPLKKILGKLAYEAGLRRGSETECSIMNAFEEAKVATPKWFRGIEWAPKELDGKGIDFVVGSDIGQLYLQVKSSNRLADKFRTRQDRRRYNRHIAVVSTEGCAAPEDICMKVFNAVARKRSKLLVERGQIPSSV